MLDDFASDSEVAWPSQKTLAEILGASDRSVRTWLNELVAAGLLTVQRRRNSSNLHSLEWPTTQQVRKPASGRSGSQLPLRSGSQLPIEEESLEEESLKVPPYPQASPGGNDEVGDQLTLTGDGRPKRSERKRSTAGKYDPMFLSWWQSYPRDGHPGRGDKAKAAKAFAARRAEGVSVEEITDRLRIFQEAREAWAEAWAASWIEGDTWEPKSAPLMNAASFLNGKFDEWDIPPNDPVAKWPGPMGWDHKPRDPGMVAAQKRLDEIRAKRTGNR